MASDVAPLLGVVATAKRWRATFERGYVDCMEERYWLRHPSLNGHVGPYLEVGLRRAIESSSMPRDSYVLVDSGQSEDERMASTFWRPATVVLGMAQPPAPAPAPPVIEPERPPTRQELLNLLREDTAYGSVRGLISTLTFLTLLFLLVAAFGVLLGPGEALFKITAHGVIVLEALGAIAAAAFLQGMLDIADSGLRRPR